MDKIVDVVAPRSEDQANYSYNYFRTIPQHIRPGYHNVTDGQTDGRTTYDSNTALVLRASRGKKVEERMGTLL